MEEGENRIYIHTTRSSTRSINAFLFLVFYFFLGGVDWGISRETYFLSTHPETLASRSTRRRRQPHVGPSRGVEGDDAAAHTTNVDVHAVVRPRAGDCRLLPLLLRPRGVVAAEEENHPAVTRQTFVFVRTRRGSGGIITGGDSGTGTGDCGDREPERSAP